MVDLKFFIFEVDFLICYDSIVIDIKIYIYSII